MPSKFVHLVNGLLEVRGVTDYLTLISLLLSRYGSHLLNTWQVTNCSQPSPVIQQPVIESLTAP